MVKAFGWREVVLIYEDTEFRKRIGPYLTDSFMRINAQLRYRIAIFVSAAGDHILQELYKLKTLQTRVFVVHMLPTLASCFFLKVEEVGLMNKGYVWIISDVLTILSNSLDVDVISSMHGVLSVKPYVPNLNQLQNFTQRWRKLFRREHPNMDRFELSLHGLWAYDSAMALAMAVERSGIARSKFKKPVSANNLTDLAAIGYSEMGPRLLQAIKKIKFQGLSGEFHLVDGQLQQSAFQIVNVIGKGEMEIGFWTREYGISKKLRSPINKNDTNDEEDLEAIIWPDRSGVVPKGWEIPTDGHPNCTIDCDEDLVALYALVVTSRIARVDVVVKESIGSIVAVTVADGCSGSLTVGGAELISDVGDGFDMISSFCNHGNKELKPDGWRIAIKGVGQVFVDGAAGFQDSLCKYSLFHCFKFVYSRNDSERVVARCRSMNCTWFVKANLEKPSGMFRIKEFMNEHCCGADVLSTTSSRSSSGLIGRLFSETMRLTPSKRAVDVKKELKLEYGLM
ncbi:hypothetical protein Vadar_030348 [Vaccinium darrowii]|uniref:Uncharacterized protein n=1 Tax=Vaccinium darrowii TaxID=229202 RepID=A0ACB7YZL7_9ERIC|nr:hypothetical protein Vadar_030348 [Vaccinium darrowii]